MSMFDMIKAKGPCIDARNLKEAVFIFTGEFFSVDEIIQAVEDLLVSGDMKAIMLDKNTILLTYVGKL